MVETQHRKPSLKRKRSSIDIKKQQKQRLHSSDSSYLSSSYSLRDNCTLNTNILLPDIIIPGLPLALIPYHVQAVNATTDFFAANPRRIVRAADHTSTTNTMSTPSPTPSIPSTTNRSAVMQSIFHRMQHQSRQQKQQHRFLHQQHADDIINVPRGHTTTNGRSADDNHFHLLRNKMNTAVENWLLAVRRHLRDNNTHYHHHQSSANGNHRSSAAVSALQHLWTRVVHSSMSMPKSISISISIAERRACLYCAGHLLMKSSQCRQWLFEHQAKQQQLHAWMDTLLQPQSQSQLQPQPQPLQAQVRLLQREAVLWLQHLEAMGYADLYPTLTVTLLRFRQVDRTLIMKKNDDNDDDEEEEDAGKEVHESSHITDASHRRTRAAAASAPECLPAAAVQAPAPATGAGTTTTTTGSRLLTLRKHRRTMVDWRFLRDEALTQVHREHEKVAQLLSLSQQCLDVLVPRMGVSSTSTTVSTVSIPPPPPLSVVPMTHESKEKDEHDNADDDGNDNDDDIDYLDDGSVDWEDGSETSPEQADIGFQHLRLQEQQHMGAVERTLATMVAVGGLHEGALEISWGTPGIPNNDNYYKSTDSDVNLQVQTQLAQYIQRLSTRHRPRLALWIEGLTYADNLVQVKSNRTLVASATSVVLVSMPSHKAKQRKVVLHTVVLLKAAVTSILQSAKQLSNLNSNG